MNECDFVHWGGFVSITLIFYFFKTELYKHHCRRSCDQPLEYKPLFFFIFFFTKLGITTIIMLRFSVVTRMAELTR